ncbi:MAG: UDP-N-acetylmuramoyl-L-alanine--D-glutamate ligase, partial [Geminicoccales bacterium]
GMSCARHLAARGDELMLTDSRVQPPALPALRDLLPDARVSAGGFDLALLDEADRLVVSPGVPLDDPFVRAAIVRGLPVIGDIDLFLDEARAPLIAVTGSNGKSTVTSLVAAMLAGAGAQVRAGGNLGAPALTLLEDGEPDFYVLELSSFQLERTSDLRARAAVVLNISPDHLDRYASLEEYAAAKATVYGNCEVAVVNRDQPIGLSGLSAARISFGLDAPAAGQYGILEDAQGVRHLARGDERLLPAGALALAGTHNQANALAALALVEAAGCAPDAVLPALASFRGLPHRCERVGEIAGVTYVDDSKGTNVGATVTAVRGFAQPIVLIAGGLAKGADFAPLAVALEGHARAAVLIGRDAPRLADALDGVCPIVRANDMVDAVREASRIARAGDLVLLSPACASQDMFEDYRARGAAFAAAVRALEPTP